VRSARPYPALFTSGWDGAGLGAAAQFVRELPELVRVSGPVEVVDAAATAIGQGRAQRRTALRLFRLDELVPPADVDGEARAATADERGLVVGWYRAFGARRGAIPPPTSRTPPIERSNGTGVAGAVVHRASA
jgi:hypothetical protein